MHTTPKNIPEMQWQILNIKVPFALHLKPGLIRAPN